MKKEMEEWFRNFNSYIKRKYLNSFIKIKSNLTVLLKKQIASFLNGFTKQNRGVVLQECIKNLFKNIMKRIDSYKEEIKGDGLE